MPINQPSNQIKLTNVSLVRLKKGKKRFEIACYKNTVTTYRSGNEKDLDNVLQIPNVFLNASKGQVANNEELKKAFPGMSRDEVVLERVHKEVIEIVTGMVVDPKSKRAYTSGMIEKALDQLSNQGGHAGRQAGKQQGGGDSSRDPSAGGAADGSTEGNTAADEKAVPERKWKGVNTNKNAKAQALDAVKALVANQPIPVERVQNTSP